MKFLLLTVFSSLLICANSSNSSRVYRGNIATVNQFPFMVTIQRGMNGIWQHVCGGAIISQRTILSAAFCFGTNIGDIRNFRIRAGILHTNDPRIIGQTVPVERQILHPQFNAVTGANNIALLILTSGLTWSDSVRLIEIPQLNPIPTDWGMLIGWGLTSQTNFTLPEVLHFGDITAMPNVACRPLLGPGAVLDDASQFCTGTTAPPFVSACRGDMGSPWVQQNAIIGVVARYNVNCGTVPTVYTRIGHFREWIITNRV